MSEITQRVNDLRFQILRRLSDGEGALSTEDAAVLVREFESGLAEERLTLVSPDVHLPADRRSRAVVEAEKKIDTVRSMLVAARGEDIPSITEALNRMVAERDEALALPEHEYECWHHEGEFQSPARRILLLSGSVDHDETGAVVQVLKFRKPVQLILCPACKLLMKIRTYLGQRQGRQPSTPVAERRDAQRQAERVRE